MNRARWIALSVLAASLLWVGCTFDKPDSASPSSLPGLHVAIYLLLGAQIVLLVAIFACITLSKVQLATEEGYEPTLKGRTAWFVALLGWLIGGGFSAGLGLWTAQTLGTWTYPAELAAQAVNNRNEALRGTDVFARLDAATSAAPIIVPQAYVWASVAMLIVLAFALVGIARLAIKVFGKNGLADLDDIVAEHIDLEDDAPDIVLARVARGRRFAKLTDSGPSLVASLVLVASSIVLISAALIFVIPVPGIDGFVRGELGGFAVGANVALVLAFVGLVAGALRNRQTRRVASILWDVITFWPRANHPLTPPSYGGRTVLDLRLRMLELVNLKEPTRVVLVAHSQGTVIAAATLMQATEPKERYPLLTFGSPLRRLYACNFPAYFGREALDALSMIGTTEESSSSTPRWINLWALSDPIGSWVFVAKPAYADGDPPPVPMRDVWRKVDCRIFDVEQQIPRVGMYAVSRDAVVCGHSGFWSRGEYITAIDLLQMIVAPDSAETVNATLVPTERAR